MKNPGRIWRFGGARRQGIGLMLLLLVPPALYLSGGTAKAEQSGQTATARTRAYVFIPSESTVVETGGFAGVHETYFVTGRFQLNVDTETGVASCSAVDTKLTAANGKDYAQSLDALLNMAGLAGVPLDETTIQFEGKTTDGTDSDVRLTLILMDDSAHLVGGITPPLNSADMFFYDLNAVAIRKYAGGTGEPNTPYLIYTPEQMNAIGAEPNDWDKHFKLIADIDLGGYGGTAFNIIAPVVYKVGGRFTGSFDGGGHTISNFTYGPADANSVALFGNVRGRIENVCLIDPNIDSGSRNGIAPLVDWLNGGSMSGCYVRGGRVSGNKWAGGLVAYNTGTITDCFSTAAVDGLAETGGLTGYNDGTITGCSSAGKVTGNTFTGGLVGWNDDAISDSHSTSDVTGVLTVGGLTGRNNGTVCNSSSTGCVTGISSVSGLVGRNYGVILSCSSASDVFGDLYVGGLVGFQRGSIANSYAAANVQGNLQVGGLVGRNERRIGDCYSAGSVFGDSYVGGLVGWHLGEVFNCYSAGGVTGRLKVGGLVGFADLPEDTIGSFWDVETSGQTASAAGIGKTTTEMQTAKTFLDAGWDFVGEITNGTEDIWRILEGLDYPRLWWEAE